METGGVNTGARRLAAHRLTIPSVVLVLSALSAALLIWALRTIERQKVDFEHIDALMDIQIRTALFHLAFEEAIVEGGRDDMQRSFSDLDAAVELSQALLHGGKSGHGTPLSPLEAPPYRGHAERISSLLADFQEIAFKRYEDPKAAAPGSALDGQFDAVFREIEEAARTLAVLVEMTLARDHADMRRLLFLVVLLWTVLVAASTWGLHNREIRRQRPELALEKAYEEMEKRVLDRTAELAGANRQLQEEISERRRAEDSLRESEGEIRRLSVQFRSLLDTIPDRITLVSRDLKVLWANRGAALISRAAGRDPGEEYCHTLWHNQGAPCDGCPAAASFANGRAEDATVSTPDGRHWEVRTVPIAHEDGTIDNVLEVATDITEKVALHAETMRAAHLASIGELAAGVAHEINNPVNGIINYAQILRNKSAAGSREHDVAGRILKEGERIGDIVSGLLSFARERKEGKGPVRAETVLAESLDLTRSQMSREGIVLRVTVPEDLPEVVANPRQIQQVLMNLISNARYALNEKYPAAHENKVLEIRGERIAVAGVPFVRLTFRDRGTGIPAHLVHKVMGPFFSTKPAAKGTGLGLSISHGIVSDHGGRLAIESVEGEFTSVVVELPAREDGHGENSRRR